MNVDVNWTVSWTMTGGHLCPDSLRYEQMGVADTWRGRVVRAFLWAMRFWR